MITIVIGDNCPACDSLKKDLIEREVNFSTVHRQTMKGKKLCKKYRIKSVPTTIIKHKGIEKVKRNYSPSIAREIERMQKGIKGD